MESCVCFYLSIATLDVVNYITKIQMTREEPPEPFVFLEARDNVPLKSEFKSSVKVLSRQIKVASPPRKAYEGEGAGRTAVADEEDSDDDAAKKPTLSAAERQEKARREREEKQRKYQEAREKLFGPSKPVGCAIVLHEYTSDSWFYSNHTRLRKTWRAGIQASVTVQFPRNLHLEQYQATLIAIEPIE